MVQIGLVSTVTILSSVDVEVELAKRWQVLIHRRDGFPGVVLAFQEVSG